MAHDEMHLSSRPFKCKSENLLRKSITKQFDGNHGLTLMQMKAVIILNWLRHTDIIYLVSLIFQSGSWSIGHQLNTYSHHHHDRHRNDEGRRIQLIALRV